MKTRKSMLIILMATLFVGQSGCSALQQEMQTPAGSRSKPRFKPGLNLFSARQDVEIGRRSADQIMRESPMLNDPQIVGYVRNLGARLAAKAAGERFPYQFQVVATREINAFALPGGFLFVNAGAIAAAKNEGELAGVIAHEIAHAALRHGTNQASKQRIAQMGLGLLGTIASSGEDPNLGQTINAIGGLGANMLFLKFGRGAEKEADLEGARIMAEAGYDPRDMASFFKTLQQGGGRVPEMLSDHPDPGNRIRYIAEEIPRLPVVGSPVHSSPEFDQIQARLTGNSSSLRENSQLRRIGPDDPTDLELRARPELPSNTLRSFEANDGSFALQVPGNWNALGGNDSTYIFAPKGAYGELDGTLMVTHGIFIGAIQTSHGDLRSATIDFLQRQIDSNADFQLARRPQQIDFGGQEGYVSAVAGPSAINGVVEIDVTYTTVLGDGRMFYIITIAPEDEAARYDNAFQQILSSLQLAI